MFRRDHGSEWSRWLHANPAGVIRRVTTEARYPLASAAYRRLMTVVDAELYTRPDYPELTQLGNAVEHHHRRNP